MPAPPPRLAATIVLARPAVDGFEVLLVKRHGKSGFMAGAHVFPGGKVDDDDAADFFDHPDVAAEAQRRLPELAADVAAGFFVAAIRETFEEAGILLAKSSATGARLAHDALEHARPSPTSFRALLASAAALPLVEALTPWAWWITPEEEPKRFDTRFFLAEVAAGTDARIDDHEATQSAWLAPRGALDAYARGEIVLAPPTLATREDLAPFASVDEARAHAPRQAPPICPRLLTTDAGLVLALPGDALHDDKRRAFARRTRIVMNEAGRFESRESPA